MSHHAPASAIGDRLQIFQLPDVGEGLTEADILGWRVAVGDPVAVNQILVEIETAKAAVELPAPHAGRVHQILVGEGDTVDVGRPIIVIDTRPEDGAAPDSGSTAAVEPSAASDDAEGAATGEAASNGAASSGASVDGPAGAPTPGESVNIGEAGSDGRIATLVGFITPDGSTVRRPRRGVPSAAAAAAAAADSSAPAAANSSAPAAAAAASTATPAGDVLSDSTGRAPLATPPVRKLAKDLGIDLRSVTASGSDGVISRADVTAAAAPAPAPAAAGVPTDGERRVPVKGVRKATAAAMVTSAFTAPHVTEFLAVDVTETMALRERLKASREFRDVKLTPLAFVARAVCAALKRTPDLNASWQGDEIVYRDRVNLGIAASTPRGLLVPNIADAQSLDLRGLTDALNELTEVAKAGKTTPAAMAGGTFTITNVGVFGVDSGTPILNPGESGILAVGQIKQAPWVVDGQLAVRQICQLAVSFDHRVVDGEQGSRFLADVGRFLEDPATAFLW